MNKIAAKQIKTSPMQLWIALDDGRRVEIRTKHKGDKPMIGDPVFDEEGKLILDGELTTAETGERIVIESGVISEIIDTTLESEPVQKWNKGSVISFVRQANQMLHKAIKSKLSPSEYVRKSDIAKLQRQLAFEDIKDRMLALESDIKAFQGKLKDELELLNKMK